MAVLMLCENQGLFLYPPHMIKKHQQTKIIAFHNG